MLMSLVATFIVDYTTGNPWIALLAAVGVAGIIGAFFALTAIRLRMDQIASGLAIYLLGLGLSFVIFTTVYPSGLTPNYVPLPPLAANWNVIPYVGIIFLKQNVMA